MIQGISHITFIVKDLEKMTEILTTVFNAEEIYNSGEDIFSFSEEKFFLIGDLWIAIMKGEESIRDYNHIAFKIKDSEIDDYLAKIDSLNLEIKGDRNRIKAEGKSIYFYDHDNHLFELHIGTLEERLKGYSKN